MSTATLRRLQIVDTNVDAMRDTVSVALKRAPVALRRRVDETQVQAWLLRFQDIAAAFVVDATARKHWLFIGGRWLATRLLLAVLLSG